MKEIENFTKKHRYEVFFCIAFVFACFFSFFIFSPGWGIFFATVGAIIGLTLADKVGNFARIVFRFVNKQDTTIQIIMGVAGLLVSIFLSPLVFFFLGVHGGKCIQNSLYETKGDR